MTTISKEEVQKLAQLARIAVSEDEVAGLQKDMSAILGYVERLNELDITTSPEERDTAAVRNVMAADKKKDYEEPRQLIAAAPEHTESNVVVKNIL